ncbi:MAG: hypothetical protein D6690_13265 [Nitrospirae bacterium]|nr:MAG: hypothetical protein D6690_13265 [Nitrospirota bacterium]
MSDPFRQAADQLIDTFPCTVEPEILADYGLMLTEPQRQDVHWMMVVLWLYWVNCGLRVSVPKEPANEIERIISYRVEDFKKSHGGWAHDEDVHAMVERLHTQWDHITKSGNEPIAVLSHAVSVLEDRGTIKERERHQVLAFFLDYVAIEEIGSVLIAIEAQFAI